jgi:hypothetical protein
MAILSLGSIYWVVSINRLEPVLWGFCIAVIVVLMLFFMISYYFARMYIISHRTIFTEHLTDQIEKGEE